MAENEVDLWERQPGEGPKPWEAFVIYRDMPDRALRKVAKQLGKSLTIVGRWSSEWNWLERVAAWDNEQDRISRKAHTDEIAKMRKRHAKLAAAMLEKSAAALAQMSPEDMKPQDVARMVDIASKLEKLSLGDVTEVIEERDGGTAEPAVQFYIPDNNRG